MKKKGKSFIGYLILLVGFGLGALAICLAVMMIGKIPMAGLVYASVRSENHFCRVSEDGTMHSDKYYEEHGIDGASYLTSSQVDKLVINAGTHKVTVRQLSGVEQFNFNVQTFFSGIYKTKKYPDAMQFNIVYDKSNLAEKTLTLNFETPSGLCFNNGGDIVVDLPSSMAVKVTNIDPLIHTTELEINTTKGSVDLGGYEPTGKTLNKCFMRNVSIKTEKGSVEIGDNFLPIGTKLNVSTKSGKIELEHSISNKLMDISFSTENGKMELDGKDIKIAAKSLSLATKKADIRLNDVDGDVNFDSDRGRLFANKISGTVAASENTRRANFDIKEIGNQFSLPKGDYCDVNIEKIGGKVEINSKNNNISIANATADIFINTSKGNVTLKNCSKMAMISCGNAKLNLDNCSGIFKIETEKGKVFGSIADLSGTDNYIKSNKGEIDIAFGQTIAFNLTAQSKKGVTIELASLSEQGKEFKLVAVNGGSEDKAISISSNKKINLKNMK